MDVSTREARAHHYVPQCWLAGFTDTGERDGMLYVTDLKRRKQWRCKPSEAGHRRDFNRIDDPKLDDPIAIEKAFSDIESSLAPVLRALCSEERGPKDGYEVGVLAEYMAVQWVRVPDFRGVVDRTLESKLARALETPESWNQLLKETSISLDDPNAEYERQRRIGKEIKLSLKTGVYFKHGSTFLPEIEKSFSKRYWSSLFSPSGNFIGSDNPVALDGPFIGDGNRFETARRAVYPVSRHLYLYGNLSPTSDYVHVTTKLIAMCNTFTMLNASEQLYSHRPDFHWLDSEGKCRNDWEAFAVSDFAQCTSS